MAMTSYKKQGGIKRDTLSLLKNIYVYKNVYKIGLIS